MVFNRSFAEHWRFQALDPDDLAPAVRSHPRVVRLARLAGDIICWTNDLLSYEKEQAHDKRVTHDVAVTADRNS